MELFTSKQLKETASQRLAEASYSPRKMVLIHAGVALACSAVLMIVNFILEQQVAGTGGLSGIGTRAALQSAQSMLSLITSVGLPFWEIGFVAVAMGYARRQQMTPGNLLHGFRRFGPLLRLYLLQMLLYVALMIVIAQVATSVVLMTPLGTEAIKMYTVIEQSPEYVQNGMISDESMAQLMAAMTPALVVTGVLFAVVAIPIAYRLRLAQYMVLEKDGNRARLAMAKSRMVMRGNCMTFFKLDLSFWWYWLFLLGCSALSYGPTLLAWLGVQLPFGADVAVVLFYGLQMAATLVLALAWRAPVETAYALAYDTLTAKTDE